MDVHNVFLHYDLDDEVYMKLLLGFCLLNHMKGVQIA